MASLDGMAHALAGDLPGALDRMEQAAQGAREAGSEDAGVTAFRDAALTAAAAMDYARASRLKDQGLRYADAVEQSYCAHVLTSVGALLAWAAGSWDEAVAMGAQALTERGSRRGVALSRIPLGLVAMGRGELAEARRQLEAATAFWERAGTPEQVLAAGWGLAEAALLDGDPAVAIDRSETALEVAARIGSPLPLAPFAVTGTRARLAAGLPAEAGICHRDIRDSVAIEIECQNGHWVHAHHGVIALAECAIGVAELATWLRRERITSVTLPPWPGTLP